jgi:hypothetical protein
MTFLSKVLWSAHDVCGMLKCPWLSHGLVVPWEVTMQNETNTTDWKKILWLWLVGFTQPIGLMKKGQETEDKFTFQLWGVLSLFFYVSIFFEVLFLNVGMLLFTAVITVPLLLFLFSLSSEDWNKKEADELEEIVSERITYVRELIHKPLIK